MNKIEPNTGGLTGENLVFIVGCPRSGTTWLQRLLATHPQIQTGQESRLFEYVGPQCRLWRQDVASTGRGGTGLACYLTEPEFLTAQKNHLASLLAYLLKDVAPGQIFLEKTPAHALFVPEIHALLPAAKIIHLVRDPRDTVASLLAAGKGWGQDWAPRSAHRAARMWRKHVGQARAAGAVLPPGQFLEVRYENLVEDPNRWLVEISRFLNLAWSDPEIISAVAANSAGELRSGKGTPIPLHGEHGKATNRSSVQDPKDFVRKARPGSWREDLTWLDRGQIWLALLGFKDVLPVKK